MLALQIADTKQFMAQLLKGGLFDGFALRQFDAETFAAFHINGERNHTYFSDEKDSDEKFCSWAEIRPYAYLLIKGNRLPKTIKIVFSLNEEQTAGIANAAALFLNISFGNGIVSCTTGCSQKAFALDKSLDQLWDTYTLDFFKAHGVAVVLE